MMILISLSIRVVKMHNYASKTKAIERTEKSMIIQKLNEKLYIAKYENDKDITYHLIVFEYDKTAKRFVRPAIINLAISGLKQLAEYALDEESSIESYSVHSFYTNNHKKYDRAKGRYPVSRVYDFAIVPSQLIGFRPLGNKWHEVVE